MTITPSRKTTAIAATGAAIFAAGAGLAAFLFRRMRANPAEHAAPDLAMDKPHPGPDDRAPEAFRPDPTAVPSAGERESLRPATGPAPGFAADRNTTIQSEDAA